MKITYDASLRGFEVDLGIPKIVLTEKFLDSIKGGKSSGIKIDDVVDGMSEDDLRKTLKYVLVTNAWRVDAE